MTCLPVRESRPNAEDDSADQLLAAIQDTLRGPGGAIAVIKNGKTLAHHTYGYADLDRRILLTPQMPMPICSISKHMACLVVASLEREPTPYMDSSAGSVQDQLSSELNKLLPHLVEGGLKLADLYNMQSGIRDYWAMTTLWGAHPEAPFSITLDAPEALTRTKSFHFQPGTEYSYSNVNFRILGALLETVSGQSLGQLLDERVFKPAGMKTAALCPNTFGHPLPVVGYEGDEKRGYVPAVNRIEWSGDAGIVASLDDMIAYEKWLERTYAEEGSLYNAIAQPQPYRDGTESTYGSGLTRAQTAGKPWLGHGGALRGFRLFRVHVPEEHLSVVTLFNHEADSSAPSEAIIKRLLNWQEPEQALSSPAPEWIGSFLDEDTQLRVIVEKADTEGHLNITYHMAPDKVKLTGATSAESKSSVASIEGDILHVKRLRDNRVLRAKRLTKSLNAADKTYDYAGEYHCIDADSTFVCHGTGSLLYGSFNGYLGRGPAHIMRYFGDDVWLLANPRGMDAQAPGDWTVVFKRGDGGNITGATIGCWLARRNVFDKKI
ncbi:Putative D-aminopeptidase/lipoprotein domain superfamily [Septoria linicola]|uniref:D-aminopeptidase/lipoprotein domain superfamily n=1 Tax=Septoria linicola TaxID=215465 RepID=A0A9Q9B588_9PEZI|nr:Putative D-aminopeptidase/lipoprotein domain superfamily [Septoria linicola]